MFSRYVIRQQHMSQYHECKQNPFLVHGETSHQVHFLWKYKQFRSCPIQLRLFCFSLELHAVKPIDSASLIWSHIIITKGQTTRTLCLSVGERFLVDIFFSVSN